MVAVAAAADVPVVPAPHPNSGPVYSLVTIGIIGIAAAPVLVMRLINENVTFLNAAQLRAWSAHASNVDPSGLLVSMLASTHCDHMSHGLRATSAAENAAVIMIDGDGAAWLLSYTSSVGLVLGLALLIILIVYPTAYDVSLSSSVFPSVSEISMRVSLFVVCVQTGHVAVDARSSCS